PRRGCGSSADCELGKSLHSCRLLDLLQSRKVDSRRVEQRLHNCCSWTFRLSTFRLSTVDYVCSTPVLNSFTSGFSDAASSAHTSASRVCAGSMMASTQRRAAAYRGSVWRS